MSNLQRAVASLATGALCLSLAACAGAGAAGGDVASVNGQKISRSQYDAKLEASPAGKGTLAQLIQAALIEQYARDKKIDVTDAEITKREADIKSKYPPNQFDAMLKQNGLTETDVHNILRQDVILVKAVSPQVHVSEADIKAYFDKNHTTYDKPAQVRARHILVADLKTANEVEAKLKAGAKFEDLAKQYSTDPSSKDKGGELGFFGKGQMVPAFQDAAFAAPVGTITAPVKSPFGFHIIQVEEKKPASTATLASTHDQIRDLLKQQQENQQKPVFMAQLRQTAKIDIYDDKLKDALPPVVPPAGAGAAGSAAPAASAAPAPATSGK